MSIRRTLAAPALATATVVAAAVGVGLVTSPAAGSAAGGSPVPGETVALAPVVAAWPQSYTVTGMKSEPLYTEHIRVDRDGDRYTLAIDVVAQGDSDLGSQEGTVTVRADGAVSWSGGCVKAEHECADDRALRGFLAGAALLGLARDQRLPAEALVADVHGTTAVCIDDAQLYPDAPPAVVALDPCFAMDSGAPVAQRAANGEFVGATLAPGFDIHAPTT